MCFSGSADSTIICWSIPSLDIDPYGPYRKFSKYNIYLFIYVTYCFFPFFFWHFAKKVVEHLMEGGRSLTSCFSFDKLK